MRCGRAWWLRRSLQDADWRLSKAAERETLLGALNMVPLGRENRGTQTSYSDVYMQVWCGVPL